jgi:signal transduction histidine kinase
VVARIWRLSSESSGLVLGLTFLSFVQRYNLLRLSLSFRSMRHFVVIMLLVLLIMVWAPITGVEETQSSRRLVAWSLIVALLVVTLYAPVRRAAVARFRWLRRVLGESIGAEEIDALGGRIRSIDGSEAEIVDAVAAQIEVWLGAGARFLPPPATDSPAADAGVSGPNAAALGVLWRHFRNPDAAAFNRLDPPSAPLAEVLGRADLHAVFPLRVAGRLEGVLGLEVSTAGGGYQDGEMESVRLVLGQLGTTLELRRMIETRLSEERRLAERERLSLLGMVSASLVHEVKNPLSSIRVLAQTVRDELAEADPESDQAEDLGLIVEQIDRLNSVAHEILGFARAPQTDAAEATDLAELIRNALRVLRFQARTRGVEIDDSGVERVGPVTGTAAAWQTVVVNLATNAVEHAPSGSTVAVRLAQTLHRVVFETRNPGPPISEEVARHLFEDFVSDGGTGLGLSLAAARVRELGGSIDFNNEPDRIVFRVTVPITERPEAENTVEAGAPAVSGEGDPW